jgi:hypothetical protein
MTKEIHINNGADLLEFIRRDEVTAKQGVKVVCAVLKLISLQDKTKAQLIEVTEFFITNYYTNNDCEKPLFLEMLIPDIGDRTKIQLTDLN